MPKYYEISEAAAKRAKAMNSYSDYAPGSATAGYRAMVDEAYALAEKQKAQVGEQYRCRPSGRKALPHTGQGRVSATASTVSDLSSTGSRGSTAERK